MKVPVKIEVDDNRKFSISVGVPPTSSLLLSEAGVEKGSGTPKTEKVGNLSFEQVVKVSKMKMDAMLAFNIRSAVKEAVGTCTSLGLTIDDKETNVVIEEIEAGIYDKFFE